MYSATPILIIFNFPLEYVLGGNIHKFMCLLRHSSVIGILFWRGQRGDERTCLELNVQWFSAVTFLHGKTEMMKVMKYNKIVQIFGNSSYLFYQMSIEISRHSKSSCFLDKYVNHRWSAFVSLIRRIIADWVDYNRGINLHYWDACSRETLIRIKHRHIFVISSSFWEEHLAINRLSERLIEHLDNRSLGVQNKFPWFD